MSNDFKLNCDRMRPVCLYVSVLLPKVKYEFMINKENLPYNSNS